MSPRKKIGPASGKTREAGARNQSMTKGNDFTMLAHTTTRRPSRAIVWTVLAVLAAFVVVLAANPLVTDCTIWVAAVIVTRLAVVDRRRARRAAHRAAVREAAAIDEALAIANAAHVAAPAAAA